MDVVWSRSSSCHSYNFGTAGLYGGNEMKTHLPSSSPGISLCGMDMRDFPVTDPTVTCKWCIKYASKN